MQDDVGVTAAADAADPAGFVLNQTMLRVKEPVRSLAFYREVMGMTLVQRLDFEALRFTLYFLGSRAALDGEMPADPRDRAAFAFRQAGLLELTHNWGTEDDPDQAYHDGNAEPRGFGHIGFSVPDVGAACERFERLGVAFVKRPDEGSMQGLAFIKDPDGYWIEILEAESLADLAVAAGAINMQD